MNNCFDFDCVVVVRRIGHEGETCRVACRSGHECVALEHPNQLQACSRSTCLTTNAVVRMVSSQCEALKPYQIAALSYFATLMQRSIRSCVLALDAGLGGHAIVRNPYYCLGALNEVMCVHVCILCIQLSTRGGQAPHVPGIIMLS